MEDAILELIDLEKRIGDRDIIKDVSFNMHRGEIVGLLGPNGAGKTTLMKMILGIANYTNGRIIYKGKSIHNDKKYLHTIGGIIETPCFYPSLSGYENLRYFTNFYKPVSKQKINEIVRLMNLEQAIGEPVKGYSLGMKQRLGLAQALIHEPDLLILDEPLNGLDPFGIKELRSYLFKITKKLNTSILISSHLISEMEMLCDRVVFLKQGSVVNMINIHELDINEQIAVTLHVDNPTKAQYLLKEKFNHFSLTENPDSALKGRINRDDINSILLILIKNEIKIHEIKQVHESLEELFIHYTGGNSIA